MSFSISGIHVPHMKNTAGKSGLPLPTPKSVAIPTLMHIGKSAKPTVKKGDKVSIGTLIAEADGYISSPVYSSISGTVTKVDDMLLSNGSFAPAVYIEADGLDTVDESVKAQSVASREELIDAVRRSGVVGLGGAGFPTYVKLDVKREIDYLIVNGAECEPYITSDTRTMVENADDIAYAISLFEKFLGVKKVIIGIEKNKPRAIETMKKATAGDALTEVKALGSVYPQGAEKVIVYNTTKRVVPAGKLPIDVGCVVCNCTTLAVIAKFIKTGMPLVSKCITVDGSAVGEPKNVIAPIGAPISDILAFCGTDTDKVAKVLYGGPMMGVAVASLDMPVLKNTNAIIAMTEKEADTGKPTQCIRCGRCASACPYSLSPLSIAKAYNKGDAEELRALRVDLCMECGCCSFVCPAKRPLVETNKLGKALLREHMAKQKEKEEKK